MRDHSPALLTYRNSPTSAPENGGTPTPAIGGGEGERNEIDG